MGKKGASAKLNPEFERKEGETEDKAKREKKRLHQRGKGKPSVGNDS